MELSEKIQKLRKERGLTQEQFARELFVSRTAVSKWETGRGVPSMDSLRMSAQFFGITLDELLRAEEVITIAEKENQKNLNHFAFCMDGICNVTAVLGLLLPLYKAESADGFASVPLYQLKSWLSVFFWIIPLAMALCGVFQILMSKSDKQRLKKTVNILGMAFNISAIFLLILSGQPYPAVMFFALLLIKGTVTLMKQK